MHYLLRRTTIVVITILLTFVSFEILYRIYLSYKINDTVTGACIWVQNHTLVRSNIDDYFHRNTFEHPKGLFKVNQVFEISVAHANSGIRHFSVKTNNLGLLSDHDYQFETHPDLPEYRIVILGDSMTGPTTSTYQWVDTIEELLNKDPKLKQSVNGKQFKVYNLGWVGAGFNSFWQAYEKTGQYFNPDLVVVNYIEVDFPRNPGPHFSDETQMINYAKQHLNNLYNRQKNLLITAMPTLDDMVPKMKNFPLTTRLVEEEPKFQVIKMRDRLPIQLGEQEIISWFNGPHDVHYSDKGGEIYARALASAIAEKISGNKTNYEKIASLYSNQVLDKSKPKTREIATSVSRVTTPAGIKRIKDHIRNETIAAKVYTFYPYSFYMIRDRTNGLTIPYHKQLEGDFVKIPYGDKEDEVAYLNIICTSKPRTLSNPECFHHFHLYVK